MRFWPILTARTLVVALVLLTGVAIRLPRLGDPLVGTRNYRSAIIARGFYLPHESGLDDARRTAARLAAAQQAVIEPPVVEHMAALAYRLAGRETLLLPQILATATWILCGWCVWWIARRVSSPPAAIGALAIVLFSPYAITVSRWFQPDGLMTLLIVATVAAALRHDAQPTWRRMLSLTVLGASAVFVKPMAVFFVGAVVVAFAARRSRWASAMVSSGVWIAIVCVPAVRWYVFVAPDAVENRWYPQLLRTAAFWAGWLRMIDEVVWWPVALAALVGLLVSRGDTRRLLWSAWLAYLTFGLTFAYHIHTHSYYSMPLIPIVALSVASLIDGIDRWLQRPAARLAASWVGAALVVAGLGGAVNSAGVFVPYDDARTRVRDYERIGDVVGHSQRVAALDPDYAFPLNYDAYLSAANLPLSIDRAVTILNGGTPPTAEQVMAGLDAEFFVATVQSELDGWGNLRQMLEERYVVADRGGTANHWRYVVFDLRHAKFAITPKQLSVFSLTDARVSSVGRVKLWTPSPAHWRIGLGPEDPLEARPAEGIGPGGLTLAARPTGAAIDRILDVPIYDGAATAPSAVIKVRVKSFATRPQGQPIGSVDGPPEPVVLGTGPIAFQGWALDPLDLRRIRVDVVDASGRSRPLGETHGDWMRPDVAKLVPDAHDIFNSGWTFTLDPASLRGTALPATLHFFAESGDGHVAEIGKRTIR